MAHETSFAHAVPVHIAELAGAAAPRRHALGGRSVRVLARLVEFDVATNDGVVEGGDGVRVRVHMSALIGADPARPVCAALRLGRRMLWHGVVECVDDADADADADADTRVRLIVRLARAADDVDPALYARTIDVQRKFLATTVVCAPAPASSADDAAHNETPTSGS